MHDNYRSFIPPEFKDITCLKPHKEVIKGVNKDKKDKDMRRKKAINKKKNKGKESKEVYILTAENF